MRNFWLNCVFLWCRDCAPGHDRAMSDGRRAANAPRTLSAAHTGLWRRALPVRRRRCKRFLATRVCVSMTRRPEEQPVKGIQRRAHWRGWVLPSWRRLTAAAIDTRRSVDQTAQTRHSCVLCLRVFGPARQRVRRRICVDRIRLSSPSLFRCESLIQLTR